METSARGRHQHASIFLPRSSILCYSLTLRRGRENHLTSCRVFESGNSSSQLSVGSDHLWDDNSSNIFKLLFISTLICGVDQLAHTSACVTVVTGARVRDVACRILSPVTFPAVTLMFNMFYELKSVYCPVLLHHIQRQHPHRTPMFLFRCSDSLYWFIHQIVNYGLQPNLYPHNQLTRL